MAKWCCFYFTIWDSGYNNCFKKTRCKSCCCGCYNRLCCLARRRFYRCCVACNIFYNRHTCYFMEDAHKATSRFGRATSRTKNGSAGYSKRWCCSYTIIAVFFIFQSPRIVVINGCIKPFVSNC